MEEQPAVDPPQNLQRQARKQVPGPVTADTSEDRAGSVNIWSGRRLGPRTDGGPKGERRVRQPSAYRCHPVTDTGRTRGSEGQINQWCLFFAKGMCYQGYACTYLHRLPTGADNEAYARVTSQDIFGREKLPDRLDNRKGAGSYDRDMTTLYVNYGGAGHYATPQLRHLLLQNFGEFGPVKSIYIVPAKTIAFVKFHWRASAEFAKEAMDSQTLTGSTMNEVLSVRWANDDPNPVAVIGRKREALDAAEAAAMAAWDAMPPEEKRARLAMMHQARARKVSAVADKMPEQLLQQGSDEQLLLQHGSSREQFDEWRGIPGLQETDAAAAAATTTTTTTTTGGSTEQDAVHGQPFGSHHQQQQQQQQQGYEAQWGAYIADPQAHAQWHEYYQQQQQHGAPQDYYQQQQYGYSYDTSGGTASGAGAWYQGWRQRHKPAGTTAGVTEDGDDVGGESQPAAVGAASADGGGGGAEGALGLLAGYGSGSDSEGDDDGATAAAATAAAAAAASTAAAAAGSTAEGVSASTSAAAIEQAGEVPADAGASTNVVTAATAVANTV